MPLNRGIHRLVPILRDVRAVAGRGVDSGRFCVSRRLPRQWTMTLCSTRPQIPTEDSSERTGVCGTGDGCGRKAGLGAFGERKNQGLIVRT
jgi:hypothetical protein